MARTFVVLAALAFVFTPVAAYASVYGSGDYNADVYNGSNSGGGGDSGGGSSAGGSSSSSGGVDTSLASGDNESTVVETASGLEVAINLANGQAIPSTGYYITITPLNGGGTSFDKAEIYLDGELAYSGAPGVDGTLKWFWDTSKYPATVVKIIIYGPGDDVTTHEFHVIITPVDASTTTEQQGTGESLPETQSSIVTWLIIGLVVVLLILLIWWLIARKRRRDQEQLPPPPMYTPMQ